MEDDKPEKFMSTEQEITWEITDCKRKLIIKVEIKDFIPEIEGYTREMSEDYILKNPLTYGARVTAIKNKIFHATSIMPHLLDIFNVQISTKKVELAWVKFEKIKMVNEIFCLAVLNGNMTKFNAFPHIPGKAMARKEGLERILKGLQKINKQLRYQVRLGSKDLEVMIKNHHDYDYKPYRNRY